MSPLPPSPFMNSAAPPAVECEAVANAPAPLAATANLSPDVQAARRLDDLGSVQDGRKMSTDGQTEAAGSVRTAASDCTCENLKLKYECIDGTFLHICTTCGRKAYLNCIPEIFRVANLLCEDARIFTPDYPSIYQAMLDPTSPRALETDPVWADEAPLFLKSIG